MEATTATATITTTTTATANGMQPTNATHFATTTIETTATAAAAAAQQQTNTTAEGHLLTANNAQQTTITATTTTPPMALPLSAVPECPEPTAAAAASPTLPHAASEPAFDVQMRTQQQQKIKIYHDAKQSAIWRTDSIASSTSSSMVNKSIATAPCLLRRKDSDSSVASATAMPRRVSFPKSDNELVTGYLEPANPWKHASHVTSIAEITELYRKSCDKHKTKPLQIILEHLKVLDLQQARQGLLSLKDTATLTPNDCEPLEEIFKRIQYKAIDLSKCPLDESCLSALCQMIEYYEATNELDISYNKAVMTNRSWNICTYIVGHSRELQSLNAEGNPISKCGAESLGNALSTSNLHTLKLEHCGLKGPPLTNLCCKLYHNKVLKEMWLGYNDLDCTDAQHIADMLRFNHSIELIDISNNNIRDEGAMYLVQALILQATELERRSGAPLQRARAIEDDECVSPLETAAPGQLEPAEATGASAGGSGDSSGVSFGKLVELPEPQPLTSGECPTNAAALDGENDGDDDNTEDTVPTVRGCNQSNAPGQSMLGKLLSMNSDSSSEEAPSNISTDTLAACCSDDISEISNEIFGGTAAATPANGLGLEPTPAEKATTQTEQLSPTQQQQQQQQQQLEQSSQTERNLCDITPSTEAKTVEPNETCVQNQNQNNNNNNVNSAQNKSNNNHSISAGGVGASTVASIYEVTAEESDCINGGLASGSKPLDVNKNGKVGDDFEDTHSTDSAFDSASEGDISRHLPDEFSRLSVSLESTRLDDMAKEMAIETATIATESTECLVAEEATPAPPVPPPPPLQLAPEAKDDEVFASPKVTIAAECREKELRPSPMPTPPPPSTSPGGVGSGLRRTESSCASLSQSARNHSQSTDSLCSENSLDGSISADHPFADKLTNNDTLSRRQLADAGADGSNRAPSGLKALTLWSNNLTKDCGRAIAELLQKTGSLELLNIGKNCLSNDFVATIKDSLTKNTTLTTLGLQSAHLSAKGIETLASILTFGGNSKLQRIDIRDNKLEVESLNIIAEVLKSNKTITQIDINDEPKRLTIGSDAHLDYTRVLDTVRSMCSHNEKIQAQLVAEKTAANVGGGGGSSNSSFNRCRGGYYLGSRKISLTCQSRPLVDAATGTVSSALAVTAKPTPAAKLEVKRKTNARLRSPGPSPPTISPSSSPNRSRFHVSRVSEVSPLTSPLAQMPPQHPPTRSASSCMSIPAATSPVASTLSTSSSLPAMASVTSSTQTVKRLSVSPRSRFQVSRIYEDPQVPLANRQMPPITPQTPPINLPPTPMLKSARKAAQLAEAMEAAANAKTTTTVVIVEPIMAPAGAVPPNSTNADEAATQKLSPHFANSPTSSSSCSTSPVSNSSSSSSSTSTSTGGSSDATDATSNMDCRPIAMPIKSCPIAVFGDNDITLTKDSAAVVALSAAAAANNTMEPAPEPVNPHPQPARSRKTSWIANPTSVDKFFSAFFQRSSSPELKNNPLNAAPSTNNAQNTATAMNPSGGDANASPNAFVSVRKITPPAWSSNVNANLASIEVGTTSFLDNASRQLRDFGKQVFRQNISFNSGDVANAAAAAAALEGNPGGDSGTNSLDPSAMPECNAAHIPTNLKRALKENISPEHTINEDTLHTLQKLARVDEAELKADDAAELGDIEIVMHSELADCLAEGEQQEDATAAAQV